MGFLKRNAPLATPGSLSNRSDSDLQALKKFGGMKFSVCTLTR